MSRMNQYEEDLQPHVEKVKGVRSDGVRYNSQRGFIYHYKKSTSSDDIFTCKNRKFNSGGCKARLRKDHATDTFRKDGPPHNHPPESEEQRQVAFNSACVAEAKKSLDESPRDIYDRVLRNYPGLVVTFNGAMQRRIQRAKRTVTQQNVAPKTNPV